MYNTRYSRRSEDNRSRSREIDLKECYIFIDSFFSGRLFVSAYARKKKNHEHKFNVLVVAVIRFITPAKSTWLMYHAEMWWYFISPNLKWSKEIHEKNKPDFMLDIKMCVDINSLF